MEIKEWLQAHRAEMIEDVIALTAIESVSRPGEEGFPFGRGCRKVLRMALAMAERYGLDVENLDDYCGSAVLKGKSAREIGFFSHLDVVPEGKGWEKTKPYHPIAEDGWIYGRGSADNKGPAAAILYALRYLKESGISLKHTLRQFYGCDEERKMKDIEYYLNHRIPPVFSLVPDCSFPVCIGEKGRIRIICETRISDKILLLQGGDGENSVPEKAEIVLDRLDVERTNVSCPPFIRIGEEKGKLRVEASGRAAHAAQPEDGESAVVMLAKFICENGLLDADDSEIFRFLWEAFPDFYGSGLKAEYEDEISGRLTAVGSSLQLNDRVARLCIDMRCPITADLQEVEKIVRKVIEGYGWKICSFEGNPGYYRDNDGREVRRLTDICQEVYGRTFVPYCMGGGTYARKLPNAVGYGPGLPFQKKPVPSGHGKGHQPDECVCVENLLYAAEIYVKAILMLDEMLE